MVEAWHTDATLVAEDPEGISDGVRGRLELGGAFDEDTVEKAWRVQRAWKETLERAFAEVDLLVTPTLSIFPPRLEDGDDLLVSRCTLPVNLAGVPALSLPVPTGGPAAGQHAADRAGAQRGAAAGGRDVPRGRPGVGLTSRVAAGSGAVRRGRGRRPRPMSARWPRTLSGLTTSRPSAKPAS